MDVFTGSQELPRKAPALIIGNSQCEKTINAMTSGNICIVGDPSGSSCVVSRPTLYKSIFK